MNVWIFQTGEPMHCDGLNVRPMRAMNLANQLIKNGHNVTIWTSNFYHQEKRFRNPSHAEFKLNDSLNIHFINSPGYVSNIGLARLYDHAVMAINLHRKLKSMTSLPDIAFVGYPPIEFAYVATRHLKAAGVPVVLDVKDQWPDIFIEAFPKQLHLIVRLLFKPFFIIARAAMRNSVSFASMSKQFLNWMADFSGRQLTNDDIVVPLSSIPESYDIQLIEQAKNWWGDLNVINDNRKRIFFVGSVSQSFDFEPLLKAAIHSHNDNYNLQLVICGDGDQLDAIKNKFRGLNNVVFPGWIDRYKMLALAELSDIGIAPYKNTRNFEDNVPNKIIDYLSLGKPVITPLTGAVRELIYEYNIGYSYSSEIGNELYDVLQAAFNSPDEVNVKGKNATHLYNNKFNGSVVYQNLVDHLERLAVIGSVR